MMEISQQLDLEEYSAYFYSLLDVMKTGDFFTATSNVHLLTSIEFEDIYHSEYPKYESAYIKRAFYKHRLLLDQELDILNNNHQVFIQTKLNEIV